MASSDQAVVYPRSPKRNARRDPRLPIADLFDPAVAEQMWQSLPDECRVDHFGKNDVPSLYRGAVRREITGSLPAKAETPRFTTCYLNFRGLLGLTPDGGHLTGGTAGPAGRMSVWRASVRSTPRSFGSRLPAW